MRTLAKVSALVGLAIAAPTWAFRDTAQQQLIDKATEIKRQENQAAAVKGGPEGRPGPVAAQGSEGKPCYPKPHPRAADLLKC